MTNEQSGSDGNRRNQRRRRSTGKPSSNAQASTPGKPTNGNAKHNNNGRTPVKTGKPAYRRPGSEYNEPDTGGVINRSTNPRSVVLALDADQARRLASHLAANGPADIRDYLSKKMGWTESHNSKLRNKQR
jgi:hypothetical protein